MFVARNFVRIRHSYASISIKNNHMMTKRYISKLQFATRYVIIDVDMKSFTCLYRLSLGIVGVRFNRLEEYCGS